MRFLYAIAALSLWGRHVQGMEEAYDTFFKSLQRPLLEILEPRNGRVLDTSAVTINIIVRDHVMPSPFQESKICVGLDEIQHVTNENKTDSVVEECFEQANHTVFHANNLKPGLPYSLRVLLVDRGNVIAVSMRYFSVAAVDILGFDSHITIDDALGYAVNIQNQGNTSDAMEIYNAILHVYPNHHKAAHLLGLAFYQNGYIEEAVKHIMHALTEDPTNEGYYNSYGSCLRKLGRPVEAINAFKTALELRSDFLEARLNLAHAAHHIHEYSTAIRYYESVRSFLQENTTNSLSTENQLGMYISLCGLYDEIGMYRDSLECFASAIAQLPSNQILYNARGNVYLKMNEMDLASADYVIAVSLGSHVAMVNLGSVYDMIGEVDASVAQFDQAIRWCMDMHVAHGFILMTQAIVQPRILPATTGELIEMRQKMEERIDAMIDQAPLLGDNRDPIQVEYTPGVFTLSQPFNNKIIRQKIARMYLRFTPTLRTGSYIFSGKGYYSETIQPIVLNEQSIKSHCLPRIGIVILSESLTSEVLKQTISHINRTSFEIIVFAIGFGMKSAFIQSFAKEGIDIILLPNYLPTCIKTIRTFDLHLLIYTEVVSNRITYFLSFTRLATIQAVWYGHPETTGIPSIDYYITSEYEVNGSEDHYSEITFPLQGMGVYIPMLAINSTITVAQHRSNLATLIGAPLDFRMYVSIDPMGGWHPDMDVAIRRILKRDPLGRVFLIGGAMGLAWDRLLLKRLKLQKGIDIGRVHYVAGISNEEKMEYVKSCDVYLTAMYSNNFDSALMALSSAVPIVTLPNKFWAGRIMYGYLEQMHVRDGIAKSVSDYARLAVQFATNNKIRESVIERMYMNRGRVFNDQVALNEWSRFFNFAVTKASERREMESFLQLIS